MEQKTFITCKRSFSFIIGNLKKTSDLVNLWEIVNREPLYNVHMPLLERKSCRHYCSNELSKDSTSLIYLADVLTPIAVTLRFNVSRAMHFQEVFLDPLNYLTYLDQSSLMTLLNDPI